VLLRSSTKKSAHYIKRGDHLISATEGTLRATSMIYSKGKYYGVKGIKDTAYMKCLIYIYIAQCKLKI
jgi:hypothetical protein